MDEKIYSRRRIKKKKASRVWSILLISILALIVFFLYSAYPIFKSSCENEAKASAIRIMHYSANEIIKEYEYNDLVNISKDNDGKVNFGDLSTLLGLFGETEPGARGDLNNDARVNFQDVSILLAEWGK